MATKTNILAGQGQFTFSFVFLFFSFEPFPITIRIQLFSRPPPLFFFLLSKKSKWRDDCRKKNSPLSGRVKKKCVVWHTAKRLSDDDGVSINF